MRKISLVFFSFLFGFFLRAEEGMIIPTLLEAFESDMKAMGMKINAKDIYDANNSSLKDAILHFGGGCTSSLISDKGLVLTNHHCGYSQIYSHSTIENNIARDGFWAKNYSEELPNNGLTVTRMVRIEDVTSLVLAGTEGMSDEEASAKIMVNIARIKSESISGTHYDADIKPFDFGNSYFLLVKETFRDVRLVGAPPRSVGKFGGDQDNWVWPRHTGDFAMFRVYANQDNKPASYSEDNIPYSPIHFLPVALKDRKDNDFTMVFGFPGVTEQHTISTELSYIIYRLRPAQIKMRDLSLSVINQAMKKSEIIELNYAPKQSRISNAWKKWIGQIDGLKRADAVEKKIEREDEYTQKAIDHISYKKYSDVVQNLKDLSSQYEEQDFAYNMYIEYAYVGAEMFERARKIDALMKKWENGDSEKLKNEVEELRNSSNSFFEKYNKEIDKEVFLLHSEYYKKALESEYLPALLKQGTVEKLQQDIYNKSFLVDKDRFDKVLANFEKQAKKTIKKDPGYALFLQLQEVFSDKILNDLRHYYAQKEMFLKTYVAGKLEMYPDQRHWADANSTLRVSYGQLEGSVPRDGMEYTSHTTLDGVIEKYNTGHEDFDLLPRMLELYKEKNYGDYAQDNELWVCFTSSNHTTGGNSGSPVINGDGHLVGLNFDRSWESTMSDYYFDSSRCRNISVDIRYVLWMVDIYGEAPHIVNEMKIVK